MKLQRIFLAAVILLSSVSAGCGKNSALSPSHPVVLQIWHVYGEQSSSPMDELIEEFNQSEGREKGIIVTTANISNAVSIEKELLDAKSGKPDALEMPDLFTCSMRLAKQIGLENLIDWNSIYTEEERSEFIPSFLEEGSSNGQLVILPIAKSTFVIMMNGSGFQRFSDAENISMDDLKTWDGFFETASRYHQWSGRPFCGIDYLTSTVELYAMDQGDSSLFQEDGWYRADDAIMETSWKQFAESLAYGDIILPDLFSNTQVMTSEVLCGIGSSAAVLYYNDMVTDENGNSEPMNLEILPLPSADRSYMIQAGVGLCAMKSTEEKEEAVSVFAHWLLDSNRNLSFCADTGYMPVKKASYEKISSYAFESSTMKNLFDVMNSMRAESTMVSITHDGNYNASQQELTRFIKENIKNASPDVFPEKIWDEIVSLR